MKKSVLFVFACIMSFMANGQKPNTAEVLLSEVSSKVETYRNILIDFRYSLENTTENIKHETRGDVSLQGDKYLLNIMGTTRIFDGEKLYTIIPENEEVNISSFDPEEAESITPSKMLTFYNEGYTSEMGKVKDMMGRKIQYVRLTPIDSNAEVKDILLGIDQQTKHIYNLVQTQNNGTRITITVNSFKTNQPLPESLFQFREERYKDFYINRLD